MTIPYSFNVLRAMLRDGTTYAPAPVHAAILAA